MLNLSVQVGIVSNKPTRIENNALTRKAREDLYHRAYSRVNKAIARGFHIEAIAILESLMCDRLENLLQALHPDSKVELGSLGKLYNSVNKEIEIPESLLIDLKQWNKARGQVIHQLVKISDVDAMNWLERMAFARKTSNDGKKLLDKLRKFTDPKAKALRAGTNF
jgi:hypothetical protein